MRADPEDGDRLDRAVRRYRRLLSVLPAPFRRQAEAEMVAMFRSGYRRRRRAGRAKRVTFWCRMIADLAATALVERGARRRRRPGYLRDRSDGDAGSSRAPAAGDGAIGRHRLPSPHLPGFRLAPRANSLRHALRRLAFAPARTAAWAATLGVGIGAAVIMLALVRGVLLRPLPFAEPDRLVRLLEVDENGGTWWPSFPNFADWRRGGDVFAGIAALDSPRIRPVIYGDRAERLSVGRVSRGFFRVLGAPLARGRESDDEENAPGGDATAVVSWSFWGGHLAGRPLQGLFITVGTDRFRVVGVTEPGFRFLGAAGVWTEADVWLPLERDQHLGGRGSHGYHVVARVAPGIELSAAGERMNELAARLREASGEPTQADSVRLTPLREVVVGNARQPLTVLTAAAFLVLFVASFNLAGGLLATGIGRCDELAVRRALGATRADLATHLLVESSLLALPAALIGLAVAGLGLHLLRLAPPNAVARVASVSLDAGTAMLAVGVALSAAFVGGLAPAWTLALRGGGDALRSTGHTGGGRRESLAWRVFVATQVALTMILLVMGGLLMRSFNEARIVDLGYDARGVLVVAVSLPESRYLEPTARVSFFDQAIAQVGALPGVDAVGVTNVLPYVTQQLIGGTARPDDPDTWMFAGLRAVNNGYFDALRIPRLVASAEALPADPGAVIVDQSVAEVLFAGSSPVGAALDSSMLEGPLHVAGMVGAVREWNHSLHAVGTLYVDYRQQPGLLLDAYLLVRASSGPDLVASIRRELSGIDPVVPVEVTRLATLVGDELSEQRLLLAVAATFAAVTLCLAAVGVYSVVAFVARRRQREVGIRVALGARPSQVRRTMVGHGLRPALAGLFAGGTAAVPAGWLLRSQLFGVMPYDPAVLVISLVVLATIAAVAAYLPTRAASRQDPVRALRQQ